MLIHDKPFEPLADGIVLICTVTDIAEKGDTPKEGLQRLYSLPFDYRTVGMNRYWEAYQSDIKISSVITVPFRSNISTQEIAVIGDAQYYIRQSQCIHDTRPPTLRLSLERISENYEFENQKF